MAVIRFEAGQLVVTLERNERWFGLLRDLRVPLTSVESVEAVADGRKAVHGLRAPGLGGPQRLIGTWRARGDKQYVCVRRGQPAVRLSLRGERYDTVLVGADNATGIAAAIDAARA